MPSAFAELADALTRSGKTGQGLAAVEEGLKMADAGGDRVAFHSRNIDHRMLGHFSVSRSRQSRPLSTCERQGTFFFKAHPILQASV